jgi:hypothetical protein
VSLFVLSPEIEDRGEVEVDNWVTHLLFYCLIVKCPLCWLNNITQN